MSLRHVLIIGTALGIAVAVAGCSSSPGAGSSPSVDTSGLDKVALLDLLPSDALIAETFGNEWTVKDGPFASFAGDPKSIKPVSEADGLSAGCAAAWNAVSTASVYPESAGRVSTDGSPHEEIWILYRFASAADAATFVDANTAKVAECGKPGGATGENTLSFRSTPATVDNAASWDLFGEHFDTESFSMVPYGNLVLFTSSKTSADTANMMLKIQLETLTGVRTE